MADAPSPLVLVVDDDHAVRQVFLEALRAEGYTVLTAVDGAEALETLGAIRVDVLLLDVRMPRLDGVTLARRLRAWPHHPDHPHRRHGRVRATCAGDRRGGVSLQAVRPARPPRPRGERLRAPQQGTWGRD